MQPHNYPILIQLKGHLEFTIFKKQAILLLKKKGKQPIFTSVNQPSTRSRCNRTGSFFNLKWRKHFTFRSTTSTRLWRESLRFFPIWEKKHIIFNFSELLKCAPRAASHYHSDFAPLRASCDCTRHCLSVSLLINKPLPPSLSLSLSRLHL